MPLASPWNHIEDSLEGLQDFDLGADRKSTRLNSSHHRISYAAFCLKRHVADRLCRDPGAVQGAPAERLRDVLARGRDCFFLTEAPPPYYASFPQQPPLRD